MGKSAMFRRLPRRERGQTLIEFAFIAPIIFLFLFTIVDFGLAMDRRITIQHAVREGARYAAVHDGCLDIQNATAAQAQDIIDSNDVTVSYSTAPAPAERGDAVTVKASFVYEPWIFNSIASAFGVSGGSIDMSPSASSRLELAVPDSTGCVATTPTPTP
jgi:Flp pilus assembly protein TadG